MRPTSDARFVRVPVRVGAIIRALEKDAAKGNANAAKELRNWLAEYPPEDASFAPEELPKELRRRVYARLLAELESEEAAKQEKA